MTQSYELPSDIELDDEILLALEELISQEETIIESDVERKQELEDGIFVNKLEFSERITKKLVKLMDELSLDESDFDHIDKLEVKIDEDYRFILPSEINLFCLTKSGLYKQVYLLGGTEEFFPYGVSVDANTNQVIVRMRPLFVSSGKFFDFYLPFEDDKAPTVGKYHVVEKEVQEFISELFALDYNYLTRKIRQLMDEYSRECRYVAIKNNYQDKGLEVW